MRQLIGPVQTSGHWAYFDHRDSVTDYYELAGHNWVKHPFPLGATVYAHDPQEKQCVAFVNDNDGNLLRIPLLEHKHAEESSPKYYVNQVFRAFLTSTEVRWIPLQKTAKAYPIDLTYFPLALLAAQQTNPRIHIPSLPNRVQANIIPTAPSSNLVCSVIDANLRIQKSRLTAAQRSHVVQFIEVNGDWPLTTEMTRAAQRRCCVALITAATNDNQAELAIAQYKNPLFLAQLMEYSFYPTQANSDGYRTTVADVWYFVNQLLLSAAKILGYRDFIALPIPPRNMRCRAARYLAQQRQSAMENGGLTVPQSRVHQMVLDDIEQRANITQLNMYQPRNLQDLSTILHHILMRESAQIDLRAQLFHAVEALRNSDDPEFINVELNSACIRVLNNILQHRLQQALQNIAQEDTIEPHMDELIDIIGYKKYFDLSLAALTVLSVAQRGRLVQRLGKDANLLLAIDSYATFVEMLRTLPATQHEAMIALYQSELQRFHETSPISSNGLNGILSPNARHALEKTLGMHWQRHRMAEVYRPPTSANTVGFFLPSTTSNAAEKTTASFGFAPAHKSYNSH